MRVLVTGAEGMLGHEVRRAGERAGHELVLAGRAQLDVTDDAAVRAFLDGHAMGGQATGGQTTDAQTADRQTADRHAMGGQATGRQGADAQTTDRQTTDAQATGAQAIEAIVNCAAWTDVDGAERDRAGAFAVNALGAGHLARAAAAAGIPMVHVSTDYVFDGTPPHDGDGQPRPYVESDPTGPISAYGESKLAGEREVLAASPRHVVARTAWLYGLDGRNFVDTMLRLAGERDAVRVVDDQVGSPTWTGHLAPALLGLVERGVGGLVHLAGGDTISWHGLAREIFRQAERPCRVEVATSAEMARPAPRPAWSALASERADVLPMPDWREGLAGYLAARAGIMRP